MPILMIAIFLFTVLEVSNVITLYFFPGSQRANGVGVFNAWEKSKADPEMHRFVRYLVNWVAGTKLIFLALLIVILFTGGEATKLWTVVALIVSILSFFWRLFPIIREMDKNSQITPKGYSKSLCIMIIFFVAVFFAALLLSIFL
ncbi:hypothetical protein J0B03_05410 [Alkalibacter rhizosphaerae]|uniref:Uncharacterized protein n=1 Tax=Alkalibacter rhizosphaerae TaxID=2815577 RepID=A0A975AII3_9FIRM|nr:hypothetical protein [Alkalibacter rhizosphaerae]QSX09502.1 hypothetical protein J0B03_05410 [Alkalibacter rhizosphaerae]